MWLGTSLWMGRLVSGNSEELIPKKPFTLLVTLISVGLVFVHEFNRVCTMGSRVGNGGWARRGAKEKEKMTQTLTMSPADVLKYQNDLVRTGKHLNLGRLRTCR